MDTDDADTGSNKMRIQYSADHLRAIQPQFRQPHTALHQAIGPELLAVGWGSQAPLQPDFEQHSSPGNTASCASASVIKPQAYPAALSQQFAVIGSSAAHTAMACPIKFQQPSQPTEAFESNLKDMIRCEPERFVDGHGCVTVFCHVVSTGKHT